MTARIDTREIPMRGTTAVLEAPAPSGGAVLCGAWAARRPRPRHDPVAAPWVVGGASGAVEPMVPGGTYAMTGTFVLVATVVRGRGGAADERSVT